jgi:arylsulfatase A-like enzyme
VPDQEPEPSAAVDGSVPSGDGLGVLPDVVLVLTDDQRPDTLRRMPAVQRHVVEKGTRFSRMVSPTPTCCPSRASLLTGRVARRSGVYGNSAPNGGYRTFLENGQETRTLATVLKERGYRTGLVGKYLNGFATNALGAPAGHRPPGWDVFLTFASRTGAYYDYTLTDGTRFGHDAEDYSTDVLAARAARFVERTPRSQPLFLVFSPFAPHRPFRPAPRHRGDFEDELPSYHPPSVTENVADKPPFLRDQPRVHQRDIDRIRRRQQEQLLSVDDAVRRIVDALRSTGRLHSTLLVFTSDNGLMIGDHHMVGKALPYRFATDVPLVLRWDGRVAADHVNRRLVTTVDVSATVAGVAGASLPTDGLDLLGPARHSEILLEGRQWQRLDGSLPHPAYCGLRSDRHLFVRWADGFEELYDYENDRYETRNRAADPRFADLVASLRLKALEGIVPTPPGFS